MPGAENDAYFAEEEVEETKARHRTHPEQKNGFAPPAYEDVPQTDWPGRAKGDSKCLRNKATRGKKTRLFVFRR